MQTKDILGVPCEIANPKIRAAIRTVMERIQARHPRDWARIRRRVRSFGYIPLGEDPRTTGYWHGDQPHPDHDAVEAAIDAGRWRWVQRVEDWRFYRTGQIRFAKRMARMETAQMLALVAHELGHVATRVGDFNRRDAAAGGDEEWAAELAADFYAAKWGFEKELREHWKLRSFGHHCAPPGEVVCYGERYFRVDHRYYPRMLRSRPRDFR